MSEKGLITPIDRVKVIDLVESAAHIVIRGWIERPEDLQYPRCGSVQLRMKTRFRRKLKQGRWNNRLVW